MLSFLFRSSKRTFDTINNNVAPPVATAARPAVATTTTALPPGWHESFDPQYQRSYYYNYSSGERTWTKPEWEAPAPAAVPPVASLPPSARWEQAIDHARGKPYFYNHATGESAWALPEGASLLPIAAAGAAAAVAVAADPVPAKKQREEEPEEGEVDSSAVKNTAPSEATQVVQNTIVTAPAVGEGEKEEEEEPLPTGWSAALDPGSGRKYYYNETLSITQWHHPGASIAGAGGGGSGNGGAAGAVQKSQPAAARLNNSNKKGQPALDPMDPSSYSDTPRGGWGAGLGKETAM
jgi:WW domain